MNVNVGGYDQTVRLVLGPLLVLLGIAGYTGLVPVAVGPLPQALTSAGLAVIGLVLSWTGYTRKCHINKLLGMNTAGETQDQG